MNTIPNTIPAITVTLTDDLYLDAHPVLGWYVSGSGEMLFPITVIGGIPMSSHAVVVEAPARRDEILAAARDRVRTEIQLHLDAFLAGKVELEYVGDDRRLAGVTGTLQFTPKYGDDRVRALLTGEVEWTCPEGDLTDRIEVVSKLVELHHLVGEMPWTDRLITYTVGETGGTSIRRAVG